MTTSDDPQHRAYHQPDPSRVTIREDDPDEDGVFTVRMPIASTGDVRNERDEPLSRDALEGMAQQIDTGSVGVFLDHGASTLGGGGGMFGNRYSAIGKVGVWANPDVTNTQDGDGPALLEADARLMDPETLSEATGDVREALASLQSQVERDIPLSSSIGWREDDTFPGGNDLMEASIVGIPADPRTMSQDAVVDLARAVRDANPDVDPEELVDEFRAVVMGPNTQNETVSEDTDPSDEQSEDTNSEEESEQRDVPEWAQTLIEKQEQQTELLQSISDAVREDDEDEEDDDDNDEDEEDDDDGEQSADVDDTQDTQDTTDDSDDDEERGLEVDGETLTAEDIRELREQIEDSQPEQPDSEQESDDRDADTPGSARDNDDEEDAAKALLRGN